MVFSLLCVDCTFIITRPDAVGRGCKDCHGLWLLVLSFAALFGCVAACVLACVLLLLLVLVWACCLQCVCVCVSLVAFVGCFCCRFLLPVCCRDAAVCSCLRAGLSLRMCVLLKAVLAVKKHGFSGGGLFFAEFFHNFFSTYFFWPLGCL